MTSERQTGTVKWFSNKKGYGFITPDVDANGMPQEDIFVHQSTITSEGYRTLGDGWEVEFAVGNDDDGKPKAEDVTAPGGGPCTGPKPSRNRRSRNNRSAAGGPGAPGTPATGSETPAVQTLWHDSLAPAVKEILNEKQIPRTTGTLDLSVGPVRIKLGTRSYASFASQDRIIAEGTFQCDENGHGKITLDWKRAIEYADVGESEGEAGAGAGAGAGGENGNGASWNTLNDLSLLLSELDLYDEAVTAVATEENMATLMGEDLADPREALEASGFEMRRVVLSTKKRRG